MADSGQVVSRTAYGSRHAVPVKQHKPRVKAPKKTRSKKNQKRRPVPSNGAPTNQQLDDPNYFSSPLTLRQARQQAGAAAGLQFNPQINAANQLRRNVPGWFDQYRAAVAAQQAQQAQMATPLLQSAQGQATAAGQVSPGSQGNPDAQLAAQSRQQQAQLGVDMLQGVNLANQNYLGGLTPVSYQQQAGQLAQLVTQLGQLRAQRGQARTQELGNLTVAESERDAGCGDPCT
jgi:hypothetical protein